MMAGSRMAYGWVMATSLGAVALLRVLDVETGLWAGLALQLILIAYVVGVVTARVVCLTDRRVLVFRAGLRGEPATLERAAARDTVSVQADPAPRTSKWPRLSMQLGDDPYRL